MRYRDAPNAPQAGRWAETGWRWVGRQQAERGLTLARQTGSLNPYAVAPGRGSRASGHACPPGGIAPARGGLLSAAPGANVSIEVERLAVHTTLAGQTQA